MNKVQVNTKKGNFEIKNVYKIATAQANLFIFYEDKKVKIPLDDIISLAVY